MKYTDMRYVTFIKIHVTEMAEQKTVQLSLWYRNFTVHYSAGLMP